MVLAKLLKLEKVFSCNYLKSFMKSLVFVPDSKQMNLIPDKKVVVFLLILDQIVIEKFQKTLQISKVLSVTKF